MNMLICFVEIGIGLCSVIWLLMLKLYGFCRDQSQSPHAVIYSLLIHIIVGVVALTKMYMSRTFPDSLGQSCLLDLGLSSESQGQLTIHIKYSFSVQDTRELTSYCVSVHCLHVEVHFLFLLSGHTLYGWKRLLKKLKNIRFYNLWQYYEQLSTTIPVYLVEGSYMLESFALFFMNPIMEL